jgi:hypothetical protein
MVPAQDFGHGFLEVFPSEIYAYGIPFVKEKNLPMLQIDRITLYIAGGLR